MKGYVVMERGSEYNDETYSLSETGSPKRAYKSKASAQAECDRLNKERNVGISPEDYGFPSSTGIKVTVEFFYVEQIEIED